MFNSEPSGKPSCRAMTLLLSQERDRRLTLEEHWRITAHLATCRNCSRFRQHLRVLDAAIAKYKATMQGSPSV
jgi:putative zinc finger protein